MDEPMRFEITMPAKHRRALNALATKTGLSASDLVRLAIVRLLANHDDLFGRSRSEINRSGEELSLPCSSV
jgi:hypothetical protein